MRIRSEKAIVSILLICAAIFLSAGGICAEKDNSGAVSAFQDRIKRSGSITFRSWNGKALRMDSDTELTFFKSNAVHMFEWGYRLASYTGTYQIKSNGQITVRFNGFGKTWPDMVVERDLDSMLLRPAKASQALVMGNRGGATVPGGHGSYWPFRMLTGEEEKKVLQMIEKHGNKSPGHPEKST